MSGARQSVRHATASSHRAAWSFSDVPVDTLARSVLEKHHDARLVQEQAADEVIAHAPDRGQLVDRVMAFERGFLRLHGTVRVSVSYGVEPPDACWHPGSPFPATPLRPPRFALRGPGTPGARTP